MIVAGDRGLGPWWSSRISGCPQGLPGRLAPNSLLISLEEGPVSIRKSESSQSNLRFMPPMESFTTWKMYPYRVIAPNVFHLTGSPITVSGKRRVGLQFILWFLQDGTVPRESPQGYHSGEIHEAIPQFLGLLRDSFPRVGIEETPDLVPFSVKRWTQQFFADQSSDGPTNWSRGQSIYAMKQSHKYYIYIYNIYMVARGEKKGEMKLLSWFHFNYTKFKFKFYK